MVLVVQNPGGCHFVTNVDRHERVPTTNRIVLIEEMEPSLSNWMRSPCVVWQQHANRMRLDYRRSNADGGYANRVEEIDFLACCRYRAHTSNTWHCLSSMRGHISTSRRGIDICKSSRPFCSAELFNSTRTRAENQSLMDRRCASWFQKLGVRPMWQIEQHAMTWRRQITITNSYADILTFPTILEKSVSMKTH